MLANTRTVRIEWGDCDPMGIVYFPRYLAIFDDCTTHPTRMKSQPIPDGLKERFTLT